MLRVTASQFGSGMHFSKSFSILAAFVGLVWMTSTNHVALAQQKLKKLPPDGIDIFPQQRVRLSERVKSLSSELEEVQKSADDFSTCEADVKVLIRAVDLALQQNLFYKKNDPKAADKLLDEAERRIKSAKDGNRKLDLLIGADSEHPQLVVGGFRSRIDDSVQPYGVVLPAGFDPDQAYRLDVWLHGRGDTKLELAFLTERMTKTGWYAPKDTIVLHPFGRHCNAFKFAGETDVYESIDHVKGLFAINEDRIAIRGFSMGGAGCWHLAVHNPAHWFAANPGAGFVDTIVYQGWKDKMPFELTDARTKLMRLYDVLPWVQNLTNTKLIAYSGEVDKQRQAADRVIEKCKELQIDYKYVIGKKMGHKIDDPSKKIIGQTIGEWALKEDAQPRRSIDFATYTLKYPSADWISITGMKEQWTKAHVKAEITDNDTLKIRTEGVTHIGIDFAKTSWPDKNEIGLNINGERFYIRDTDENKPGLQANLAFENQWEQIVGPDESLRKRPGVQGPIDDAFCERFVFVIPSRPAANGVVERWIQREYRYAADRWRRLMRGRVHLVKDTEVTPEQVENCNLICFGDFGSNRYLHQLASRLPVTWTRETLQLGSQQFDPATHAAVFCYPNPDNPKRYVVVNSGMTFREFSNTSNSRQIAMLPDWAILKVADEQDDSIFAGEIASEGFFNEQWQFSPPEKN